jgi:tripartite-type tricarboxylate transporter receptor subunit TctC
MISRRDFTALAAAAVLAPGSGWAQGRYPDHPIRLIVPFAAGSSVDLFARQVATPASEALGGRIVIENRVGAGGIVGAEAVARAAPDGYTLLLSGSPTHAINVSLYARLPYDAVRDFTPVARLADQPAVLVVPASLPVTSVAELVSLAQKRPGGLNYASPGVGTTAHLCGATFRARAGIDVVHVPYGNTGQMLTDLVSGATALLFYPYQPLRPHIESGRLRVLATTGAQRSVFLLAAPTMVESGFPDFVLTVWFALYAPAEMPTARVAAASDAFRRALMAPEVRAGLTAAGAEAAYLDPLAMVGFTVAEIERYRRIVADSGARVE